MSVIAKKFCGLSLQDFLSLDQTEFSAMLSKGIELERADRRHDYEVSRFVAWLSVMPHLKKGTGPKDPTKLVKFEWEKQNHKKDFANLSPVELKTMALERFSKYQPRKKDG